MSESQSRYGIIEELNKRKINQKEKLANIERETDNKLYEEERRIGQAKNLIEERKKNYKQEYLDWKRQEELKLRLLNSNYQRERERIEELIKDREENYESDFQKWKTAQEDLIRELEEHLDRYKIVQQKKITEKKAIITELEKGISDLKEVSKESKGSE